MFSAVSANPPLRVLRASLSRLSRRDSVLMSFFFRRFGELRVSRSVIPLRKNNFWFFLAVFGRVGE
jgi:hypothetical protein